MKRSTITHDTFVIERIYNVPVAQVFRAWADPMLKARWFAGSADALGAGYELDFRVGGLEVNRGGPPGGPVYTYESRSATSFPNSGSSTRTKCTPMRIGSRCLSPASSSAPKTHRRIWSSQSRGCSSTATTRWPREKREPTPFWTRWLSSCTEAHREGAGCEAPLLGER